MSAIPAERPLAGDWTDDDGEVISDLVKPQADPLPPPEDAAVVWTVDRPARPGRLLTGSLTLDTSWTPTQILPADPARKCVVIQNGSTTATDPLRVADESAKCTGNATSGLVYPANPLTLRGHTGAVWASAGGAQGAVPVSYWAVTE